MGQHRLHTAVLVLVLALLGAQPALAAAPKIRKGPAGTAFYTPPSGALKGTAHGGVIWARAQTGPDALKSAGSHQLVLYRSIGVAGKAVAVSGSVSLPKGKAPKSGWPVIAWDHGTTGIADICAPTRQPGTAPLAGYTDYAYPLFNKWLKAGYAVVRTDYEGLGTPGDHPYLIGASEARATLDSVRAARVLQPSLSKRFVVAGHSQGGQAALWTASLAAKWTPDLKLLGTVAFAPASHLSEQASLIRALTSPGGGLSGLAANIIRGIDVADPALGIAGELNPPAAALYPQTLKTCQAELGATNSFGGLAPADFFKSDYDLTPLVNEIDKVVDPENLTLHGKVQIEQGAADTTVFPSYTDQLVKQLKAKGTPLTYKTYPGLTHGGVVTSPAPEADATAFIKKAFGR